MHPRFAAAELERARRLAIDGLNVSLAQPGTLAHLRLSAPHSAPAPTDIPRRVRPRRWRGRVAPMS
jgi:hypothetical protein